MSFFNAKIDDIIIIGDSYGPIYENVIRKICLFRKNC